MARTWPSFSRIRVLLIAVLNRLLHDHHIFCRKSKLTDDWGTLEVVSNDLIENGLRCGMVTFTRMRRKTDQYFPLAIRNKWVYVLEDAKNPSYIGEYSFEVKFAEDQMYVVSEYHFIRPAIDT